jgi:uncharacterized protein (DUF1015 family)
VVDAAPFRALRYDAAIAGDPASTSAPAYDDLGRFQYAQHRTASPYTVLELLAGGQDGYEQAGAAFRRWLRTGVLVEDAVPAFYLYEIHELRRAVPAVLRGVLAAVAVTGDTLLPHEGVEPGRVASRLERMAAVPADLTPVFAVHTAAGHAFRSVVDAAPHTTPVSAFTDESGADHRIWAVRDPRAQAAIADGLRRVTAVIADGHHRFASAVELQRHRPEQRRTLTYLVDGSAYGPELLPVHRFVLSAPRPLEARLSRNFFLEPMEPGELEGSLWNVEGPALGLRRHDRDWLLTPRAARAPAAAGAPAWSSVDAALFEDAVRPVLDGAEVHYVPGERVSIPVPEDGAFFLLRPADLLTVLSCAAAGETMPAKSTWFRPKPRAGVVMRSLDSPA